MAVVNTKATAIANTDAKPQVFNLPHIQRGKLHQDIGFVAVAATDSVASTYRLVRVRANDRMSSIAIFNDALTAGVVDIGLYETTANGGGVALGTAGNSSLFATGLSIATANKTGANVLYSKLALNQMEKRVFELLGLSADNGKEYDLVATVTTAPTAAGTLGAHVTANSGE